MALHIPINIQCDYCGNWRQPTLGESRETIADAYRSARAEGWLVNKNAHSHACAECVEFHGLTVRKMSQ